MRITEIEFSYTKNLGNYENQRIAYRATLEIWENPEESLNLLRNKVAVELNLRNQLLDLSGRFASRTKELEAIDSQLEAKKMELAKAMLAWENFKEFLTGHGVDPATLNIENFAATRAQHQYVPPKLTDIEQMRIPHDIAIADDDDDDDDSALRDFRWQQRFGSHDEDDTKTGNDSDTEYGQEF